MERILSLNLNHRTLPRVIEPSLVDAILLVRPTVLVFNEYVDVGIAKVLRDLLKKAGFDNQVVSPADEYRPGRWHNQILIASQSHIFAASTPNDGPDTKCRTNTLAVSINGIQITGIRVPAYQKAEDWYAYWEWANKRLEGDVVIGDFNADPSRARKWDRVLAMLEQAGGWTRPEIDGDWSYCGINGSRSRVDHVLVRNGVQTRSAKYLPTPFVPTYTDHAALLVDID